MALEPISFEEIFDALSEEDQEEISRADFKVPLQLFLKGFNRYPFSPKQQVIEKFRSWAKRRRAVKNEVAKNPDVRETEFKDPIIIIGLARSGTTMLHRLLLSDPQFIGPMTWEMVQPLPPGRPENWEECERLKKAKEDIEFSGYLDGAIDDCHYFRMESAEECFFITRHHFLDFIDPLPNEYFTELREFMYNFPDDHVYNTYEFLKTCLQCMFCGNMQPGKRLLLKSPIHCLYPEVLRKYFPTAKFIFSYRNAKSMVTSYSSFVNKEWKLITNSDDSHGAGKRVMELFKHSSERIVKFLKQLPEEDYITIPYTEMVENTMETVKQIYSHLNLNLPPKTEVLLQSHLQENYQHKYGKVHYKPEDFGITDELIKENMKEYLEYFANGPEKLW